MSNMLLTFSQSINETLPEGDYHFQEERRLFYVAITRAKKQLYFLSAENYGGVRKKKLSRFLTEIGFGNGEKERVEKKPVIEQKDLFSLYNPRKKSVNHKKNSENILYPLPKTFSFSRLRDEHLIIKLKILISKQRSPILAGIFSFAEEPIIKLKN